MIAHLSLHRVFRLFPLESLRRSYFQNPLQLPFLYLAALSKEAKDRGGYDFISAQNDQPNSSDSALLPEDVDIAYRIILQRRPESEQVVQLQVSAAKTPFELSSRLICSAEWVQRVNELFRAAFPSIPRLWHLHAPKTGGSAFFDAAQRAGWGYVNTNLLDVAGASLPAVAEAVRYIEGRMILVSGHKPFWQSQPAFGPFDSGIMIVRDPLARIVSYFNFASDVVGGRENIHPGDSRPFLNKGFDPASFERTYRGGFFEPNEMCFYLSADRSCRGALASLEKGKIELALIDDVSELCLSYFGTRAEKVNASTQSLRPAAISPKIAEAILAENAEDITLYQIALLRRQVAKPKFA